MKKIYALFLAVCCALCASAATFTFDSDASLNQTVDGITLQIAIGSGTSTPKYYSNGMRLYANNTITFSGAEITSVQISFAKQGTRDYASLSVNTGNLVSGGTSTSADDIKIDTWTGSANSVTFSIGNSGQRLIKEIVVNEEGTVIPGGGNEPTTPGTSAQNFVPTTVDYYYWEEYSEEGSYNYSLYLNGATENAPYFELDIYTAQKDRFEGTYTTTDGSLGAEYSFYVVSDEEYYAATGTITIAKLNNNYTITGTLVSNGVTYNISYSGELNKYDTYVSESKEVKTYNVTCDWVDVEDYITEYGDIYFYMGNDDFEIILDVVVDEIDEQTILAPGTYNINNSFQMGTIYASEGNGYPSLMYSVAYDESAGEYYAAEIWYIVSGKLTVTKNNNAIEYKLTATTAYGSTINATYEMPLEQSIDEVTTDLDKNATMYDILGRQVTKEYKGIVIQSNQKYMLQ